MTRIARLVKSWAATVADRVASLAKACRWRGVWAAEVTADAVPAARQPSRGAATIASQLVTPM